MCEKLNHEDGLKKKKESLGPTHVFPLQMVDSALLAWMVNKKERRINGAKQKVEYNNMRLKE